MSDPNVTSLPANSTVLALDERPEVFVALAASGTEVAQGLEDGGDAQLWHALNPMGHST